MKAGFLAKITAPVLDAGRRLLRSWRWALAELVGVALLIAAGLLWTRIPERNLVQVGLTLLLPVLIAVGFLALQAGTIRSLLGGRRPVRDLDRDPDPDLDGQDESEDDAPARTPLLWGAAILLPLVAAACLLILQVDRFDDRIGPWAGYLNSRLAAGLRARIFTYPHLVTGLKRAGWFLRWVAIPGLLLPLAASAGTGLRRLPWRGVLRVWLGWRWWPVLLVLALAGEAWPVTLFTADPRGTVEEQMSRLALRLLAAYALAVVSWILALTWTAALVSYDPNRADDEIIGLGLGAEPAEEPDARSEFGGGRTLLPGLGLGAASRPRSGAVALSDPGAGEDIPGDS